MTKNTASGLFNSHPTDEIVRVNPSLSFLPRKVVLYLANIQTNVLFFQIESAINDSSQGCEILGTVNISMIMYGLCRYN
jgi:hypothetical protein